MSRATWRALPPELKAWRDGQRWCVEPETGAPITRVELVALQNEKLDAPWRTPRLRGNG
jgi:hypothetical protein